MAEHEERVDLHRAQEAARAAERAAALVAEFAQRLSVVVTPAAIVEYDTLIGREASAISTRVEAFARLGLGAPSLEDEP